MLALHSIILCLLPGCLCNGNFENVALGKQCKQDSTHPNFVTCSVAVDGDTKVVHENKPFPCIHTSSDSLNPWWEVDLGQIYPVYRITLWAHQSVLHRMTGSVITVDGLHCYTISSQPAKIEINIHCASGVIYGSVVRVSKQSHKRDGDNVLNLCEVQVWSCSSLFWGPRCENKCNCLDGGVCNKFTGNCPKCDAGKYGVACKEDCGLGCNTKACNKVTGHCDCKPGWLPPLCRLENVALGKHCKQDSEIDPRGKCSGAIDGNTTGDFIANPSSCTHTAVESLNPWWEVDLGQPYPVYRITMWARNSFIHRMNGSVITVDGYQCYNISSQPDNREIHINCTSGIINGSVVRIHKTSSTNKNGDHTLNLCEVQVWSCSLQFWGPDCENKCNCSDGGVCNKITGHCPMCDTGKYGVACKENCGFGCKSKVCNIVTGYCECKPGWLPPLCRLENVALNKKCNMHLGSTVKYSCRKGVNGDSDSSEGNCILSARIKSPWWEVDLGRPYPVFSIRVWAHDGYKNRLKGLKITVDNSHCYTFTSEPVTPSNEIKINCTSGVIKGRLVHLSFEKFTFGDQTFVLNFCEFQVWSCGQQFWGDHCDHKCGNCIDGHTCDKVTGHCPCKPGFKPPLCLN